MTVNLSKFEASARARYGQDIDGPSKVVGRLTLIDLTRGPVKRGVYKMPDAVLQPKLQREQIQSRIGDLILLVGMVVMAIFALWALNSLVVLGPSAFMLRGTLFAGSVISTLVGHTAYGYSSGHTALREEIVQQAAIRLQNPPASR